MIFWVIYTVLIDTIKIK